MFSLPVEMSPEGRQEVVERMARHLATEHQVAVDYAIHAPPEGGDPRNHHAHLLMTTRRLKNGELMEKTRELDDLTTGGLIVKEWRSIVAGLLNKQMEREQAHRQSVHVEHRSFADRGIAREPTKHRGKANRYAVMRLKALFDRAVKITKCALIQTKVYARFRL